MGEHAVLSKKSGIGAAALFYDTLALYLSPYVRPTDQVVGLRSATAPGIQKKRTHADCARCYQSGSVPITITQKISDLIVES